MILKNLFRRKVRTLLTVLGISIGVAAIVGLGALANGLEVGYDSILTGSKADMILSQPDAIDISVSTVDESIGAEIEVMPEVSQISGMLQGIVAAEKTPYFFVYGYQRDSFALERFQIIEGFDLGTHEAQLGRGKQILIGASAAEALDKNPGDTLRLGDTIFRVVGIYETGDTLEDNGGVLSLSDAQDLLGRPRQVSLFYIQLKDTKQGDRLKARFERRWSDLSLSTTREYADKQITGDMLKGSVWAIAGLAILIGGVGMMNSQLMAITERTREIGVLRSLGWNRRRILWMILMESLVVCLLGGAFGIGIAWLLLSVFSEGVGFFGASVANITPDLLVEAFVVVLLMGFLAGMYPAWRASRLQPVEALRYEGGSGGGKIRRLPFGGMALQSLWQRTTRTFLTLGAISLTVGAIMALEAILRGVSREIGSMGADAEVMIRQADVADTSLSALDERIGDKIAAFPEVAHVSSLAFTGTILPDSGTLFLLFGYTPNEYAISQYHIIEGKRISGSRQIMIGKMIADALHKSVGDVIQLGGSRFPIVGVYQGDSAWQEMGGVVSLRDAQLYLGRPRKVTMYVVKVEDPAKAAAVVEKINNEIPEAHASLSGEFMEQMPDMVAMDAMLVSISLLTIVVGGVGVMNAMLMSVFERTREIGVLRALGWRRRSILSLILQEALWIGLFGGASGILIALGLDYLIGKIPMFGSMLDMIWDWDIFARAIAIALLLGLLGGLYPAYRATRLQPVEALRYE